MTRKTIALDAMGGDHGPKVIVPAALKVLREQPDLHLIFVGQQDVLAPFLRRGQDLANRFEVHHANEVVQMDELPSQALRNKKDSSMRVAIDLVKDGKAEACVSAGNTGALMATARFVLKMLPGVDRPAIMTRFPTQIADKWVHVLDLGANVDSTAEQLYQFAVMGSVAAAAVGNIDSPKVALINIGSEEIKGNEQVKKTAELLQANPHINYAGYVEGNGIFKGQIDVAVCDGFVGNVMLKSCEGILKLFARNLKSAFQKNWMTKLGALCVYPILKNFKMTSDPRRYNGATFLGLNGIVIKSHGGADQVAFACAIREAVLEVDKNVPQRIRDRVTDLLVGEKKE